MKNIQVKHTDTQKYIAKVHYDEMPDDPTTWTTPDERKVTFALHHKRYDLPFELDNKYDDEGNNIVDLDLYDSWTEFADACAPSDQQNYRFVRWYEHSGVAVSLRDDESGRDWDAGIAGVIFGETTADINREFETWKQYIEGNVYWVAIETADGRPVDSLAGLYGDEAVKDYINETLPDALPNNIEIEWL